MRPFELELTNPSQRPGYRVAQCVLERQLVNGLDLVGKNGDTGQTFALRHVEDISGDGSIYCAVPANAASAWQERQRHLVVEVQEDDEKRWCDAGFVMHPAVNEVFFEQGQPVIDVMPEVWVYMRDGTSHACSLTLNGVKSSTTRFFVDLHGWNEELGFQVNAWLSYYTAQAGVRMQLAVTFDDGKTNEIPVAYVKVKCREELTTEWINPHGLTQGENSISWPIGTVNRCTAPIMFDGFVIARSERLDDDEEELEAFRFGPNLGLPVRRMNFMLPFYEPLPAFEGPAPRHTDVDYVLEEDKRTCVASRPRLYAPAMNGRQGGDQPTLGAVTVPRVFTKHGLDFLRRYEECAQDAGFRNYHHPNYEHAFGDGVQSWDDRPHFTSSDPLGPLLPSQPVTQKWWRKNQDGQHYADALPQMFALTGNPLIRHLALSRLEMSLAFRRRFTQPPHQEDSWQGVSRESGRYWEHMTRMWLAFGDQRILPAVNDIVRLNVKTWAGGQHPSAWLRIAIAQNYAGGHAFSPWQDAIFCRGLFALLTHGLVDSDLEVEAREMIREVSGSVVEVFQTVTGNRWGWGCPYAVDWTPDEEPFPIPAASNSDLNSLWCYAAAVIHAQYGIEGSSRRRKARQIVDSFGRPETAEHARWMAL